MLSSVHRGGTVSYEVYYLAQGVAFILAALCETVVSHRSESASESHSLFTMPFAILACTPTLIALAANQGYDDWLFMLSAVLGGFSLAWCYARCIQLYAQLDSKYRMGYVLISFAIAPLIRIPLQMMPSFAAQVIAALLPLACFIMCNRASSVVRVPLQAPARKAESSTGFKSYLAALIVFGIAMGIFSMRIEGIALTPALSLISIALKVLFPLTMLLLIVRRYNSLDAGHICQIALLIVIFALAVISQFQASEAALSAAVSDFARYALVVMLFSSLTAFSRRFPMGPITSFAIGWVPYIMAIACGMALSQWMNGAITQGDQSVIYLVCFIVGATIIALDIRRDTDTRLFSMDAPAEGVRTPQADIDTRCREITQTYGLTPREAETMVYIYRGYSKSAIAEKLVLSENTVRSYAKAIYMKLDIHSRNDLIDLIDE